MPSYFGCTLKSVSAGSIIPVPAIAFDNDKIDQDSFNGAGTIADKLKEGLADLEGVDTSELQAEELRGN